MSIRIRKQAIRLRKNGYSYNEISKRLKIAKSTLNSWINKDITKNEEDMIKIITRKKGIDKLTLINKKRAQKILEKEKYLQETYAKQLKQISSNELFWLGMGLYMAEGAKTGRWKSIFYNSDPILNKIMMRFFVNLCKSPKNRIHIQLLLHNNIKESEAKNYWSKMLDVPLKNFNKASYVLSKASQGKRPKNSLPYGTVQIAVGDKKTTNKIRGWTQGIYKQF